MRDRRRRVHRVPQDGSLNAMPNLDGADGREQVPRRRNASRCAFHGGCDAPTFRHPLADDHDDEPVRVADEEAARAPRLIGQRIDDIVTAPQRFGVHGIDVGNFDRQLRLYWRGRVARHDGDLRQWGSLERRGS